MSITDNNAQTWRDLAAAGQLTPAQIARCAATYGVKPAAEALAMARDYAARNLEQAINRDVPTPDGCLIVGEWFDNGETTTRSLYGTRRTVGNATAVIAGEENTEGKVLLWVEVEPREGTDGELDAGQARVLAAALLAAADEPDQLAEDSAPA